MTKRKKNRKTEVPAFVGRQELRKKMSRKKPRKPGKFIWFIIKSVRLAESRGRK